MGHKMVWQVIEAERKESMMITYIGAGAHRVDWLIGWRPSGEMMG